MKPEETIDCYPYDGDENPLQRNKEEFKINAIQYVHQWDLPNMYAMYPNDFYRCNEIKMKFEKLKTEILNDLITL